MTNDSRSSRKSKSDEPNSTTMNEQGGLDVFSGDTVVRRSSRGTPSKEEDDNGSPVIVRKSQRLEKQTAPPEAPPVKNKPSKPTLTPTPTPTPTPLRRSGRENKFQSLSMRMSENGLKEQKGSDPNSNSAAPKGRAKYLAHQDIVEKSNGKENCKVGSKRKERLDARRYKYMFQHSNKIIRVSDYAKKEDEGNCDEAGEKKSDSYEEGEEDNIDGKEFKVNFTKNVNVDRGASDSEVQGVKREEHDYKEEHLTSNELSNDSNGLITDPKAITLEASVDGRKDTQTCYEDLVPSISSSWKMTSLPEQCTKCFRKRRLEYDAVKLELCCCLSDSMDDFDMSSVYKDRGKGETFLTVQCAKNPGKNVERSEPSVHGERGTCFTCKSTGILMHCSGKWCTRSFHASCLLSPDDNVFLPIWYCCECTKNRLILGPYSVSEGIESIWDVREVEFSNSTGVEKQIQYFVKYKGLAHSHNRWVAEVQLLHEAPESFAKFCEKKESTQWKAEWIVPHRLLKKRLFVADESDKHIDKVAGILSNDQYEWLVKWRGLDYDQATWEFQDSSCFKALDLQQLIREYETRHERARTPLHERRKGSHVKTGSFYMNSVNKLREYYNKRHNAVLLDEQDRIEKVVCLISSIVMNICRPILIISPYASLSLWEAEFLRITEAPVNVVVYGGSIGSRNIIRSLEFHEGDNIMLQVLLSSPEVISEDLDVVKGIEWETVIVDDCQQSCVITHSGSIKNLVTDWRLLLVNAQLKDDVNDYINILSLLESGGNSNQNSGLMVDSSENITVLKERLSSFISCAKFLEYWVPVQISNLQLELYCSMLLSNRTLLISSSRNDPVSSLHDILISTRKCCDHPYVVDPSLQTSPFAGLTDLLELGTKASGKLTLLDEILSDFWNKKLKVLILFQSRGDSKGDIIEDVLGIRFGSNSYERVDVRCSPFVKQAALNKFNKEKETSFFLLETQACLPSIKLTSVDAVIIFDSDWNPVNDMKALQKIRIDSKLEQIKVFRLYCCCTVEEKVLILAKNNTILDCTLQGISPSSSHKLLMWCSSYLFTRLDEFHRDTTDRKDNIVPGYSFSKDVSKEILYAIQNNETVNQNKFISVARYNGGGYLQNTALVGEQKIQLEDGVPPNIFWMKLLEGKQPQWKFISGSFQRNRKRVQYQVLDAQDNESTKKKRKMDRIKVDSSSQHTITNMEKSNAVKNGFPDNLGTFMTKKLDLAENIKRSSRNNGGITSVIGVNDILRALPDDRNKLYAEQCGLFQMLKPAISRLCEALQLTDDIKRLAEQFLEYVLKNHRVMAEPEAILQAFQISVCWSAMEALDQKIDRKKSLDVARECLNFNCIEEETEAIYSKMKTFMKSFIGCPEGMLKDKQKEELEKFEKECEDKRAELEKKYKMVSAAVLYIHGKSSIGVGKLKIIDKDCAKEKEDLQLQISTRRKEIEARVQKIMDKHCAKEKEDIELQISTRCKEIEARLQIGRDEQQKKTSKWLEQVKDLAQNELLYNVLSENDKQLEPAKCVDREHSNAGANRNSDKETSGTPGPDMTPVVSELSKPQENTVTYEVPCLGTNQDRENHHIEASIDSVKVVPRSQEDGLSDMSKEISRHVGVLNRQAVSIDESVSNRCGREGVLKQFPAASTRETEKLNSKRESVEVDRSTVLETDQVHEASTTLVTEPLPSPGISTIEKPATYPASETPLSVSQIGIIGYKSFQSLTGGANEQVQVQHVTGMQNVWPQGETALLACSDPVHSNLVPSAGVHGLPSTKNPLVPLFECHTHDHTRITPSSRLDNHTSELYTSVQGTEAQMQQEGLITELDQTVSQAILESVVNANLGRFETQTSTMRGTSLPHGSRPNPQVPIFANSRSSDPLQNELERIHQKIDEVRNIHEETQLQLKSNCDKDIEDIVARIRKKYHEKREEAEALFLLRKNELELNQKKVTLHKELAEAFRSKCMDYREASGMQQGITSGSIEHVSVNPRATHPAAPLGPSPETRPPHMSPLGLTTGHLVRHAYQAPPPNLQPPFSLASMPVSSPITPNSHNGSHQDRSSGKAAGN